MEPRLDIGRLHLRYVMRGTRPVERSRLDDVAVRLLPAALERELGRFDDGTLVVLRRVSARVRLRAGGSATEWARTWAENLASEVRVLAARVRARPGFAEDDVGVAFSSPVAALARLAIDAIEGSLGRWYWSPEAGTLKAVQRALAALPGVDGHSHAYTVPPLPVAPSASEAVEWALQAAGAALPEVIQEVDRARRLAPVLAAVRPSFAAVLVTSLGDRRPRPLPASTVETPAGSRAAGTVGQELRALGWRIEAWPAPAAEDARNVLALLGLALASAPSLRGASGLVEAVEGVLRERLSARGGEPAPSASPSERAREVATVPADALATVRDAGPLATPAEASAEGVDAELPEAPDSPLRPRDAVLPTRFGGLLFLLPLLGELEISEAILDEPELAMEPGLGAVLYLLVCQLVPEAEADAVALALGGREEPSLPDVALTPERASAVMRAGARVAQAAARRPLLADASDAEALRERVMASSVARAAQPWLRELALHFALRLVWALRARVELELPLPGLLDAVVVRAGTLQCSPTHLDLHLKLDEASLSVRRGALDVDPGWVPFLGKVVSFHYV